MQTADSLTQRSPFLRAFRRRLRSTRRAIGWIIASMFLAGCHPSDLEDYRVSEPVTNVVLVCADTVRKDTFDRVARMGLEDPLARHLEHALQFDNAYSAAPWTIPSVATVLTGRYPRQHGAGSLDGEVVNLMQQVPRSLDLETQTLAERLRENQFASVAVVAHPWFLAGYGLERGFEARYLMPGWDKIIGLFSDWLNQRNPEQRYFGYLHFMEAHHFHTREFGVILETLDSEPPELVETIRQSAPPNTCPGVDPQVCDRYVVYALNVFKMRQALASVLDELEGRELLDTTLVVFFSDHGEEFLDHVEALTEFGDDPRQVYGLGHGQSLYDELLKVPLLIWNPRIDGRIIDTPVSLVDAMPSILHWSGIDQGDEPLSGLPLEFLLDDRPETASPFLDPILRPREPDQPRPIFASAIGYGAERIGVISGHDKAIYLPSQEHIEFFDLSSDPGERQPIESDELIYVLETLVGDYLELLTPTQTETPVIDNERLEQLKAIGYLQGVDRDN